MDITYNNETLQSNMITFTDIPNILKVSDDSGGTYASINIVINTSFKGATTEDGQWYITLLGESINNVLDPRNAVNKNFYVAPTNVSTAASITRALRNCSTLIANFNIENTSYGIAYGVRLTAKTVGEMFVGLQSYVQTNIPSEYVTISVSEGSSYADSALTNALIDVDVYEDGGYVTTLEKYWYNGEAAFNLSPVLTTFAGYGKTVPYTLRISSIKNGDYTLLGNIDTNYISIGYMCNQGYKYLDNTYFHIAQNFSRGASREFQNSTLLYVYQPLIPISFYNGNEGGMTITIDYLDSAFNTITTDTVTWHSTDSSKKLWDIELDLNAQGYAAFSRAFYIDISLGSLKVRYNVIKPLKATEYSQRILWRNSYGGISFFDFTGQKSETRELEVSTYQKNIFDFYDSEINELEKVYDNDVKYSVTLKSHLFEHDGKYIFNDLIQSAQVWTEINGQDYAIILDNVSVEETDNNNIYEASVTYHYSQEPSLI